MENFLKEAIEKYGQGLYNQIEDNSLIIGKLCKLKRHPTNLYGTVSHLWLPQLEPNRPNHLWVVLWENNPKSKWGICEIKDLEFNIFNI